MTSSSDKEQPVTSTRRQRIIGIIIIVALVASIGGCWYRYTPHNVFDAIMDAEWEMPSHGNPALRHKYQGGMERSGGQPFEYYRRLLHYLSEDGSVSIWVLPDGDSTQCDDLGCKTTWWTEKFPTKISIAYSERLSEVVSISIENTYDRHNHHLHQEVMVWRDDTSLEDEDDIAVVLSEYGISNEYLRQKCDWLITGVFLPDFLGANPKIKYTVDEWGWVTITTDRFLAE